LPAVLQGMFPSIDSILDWDCIQQLCTNGYNHNPQLCQHVLTAAHAETCERP